ncbi:heavy-metal resistance protein [Planktotalea frisia]|jgi:uncharacterized membrane protein|uniref:Heavy-metal resistance n=1 Tax=Planktotalea frisia TaxID=696762 RepID=A0A1L9NTJ1_9RHOB|nr:periplasmic heavy metal sensor [Planktotalea frisia]OJI92559.1 hypothetical protein PFRI_32410 [Planktotalea frisia]PZX24036.1 heavy-metal resistance protein [Planktotalea frisia]
MSDPKIEASKPAKPSKRFRILLGVSLALNLLVVGAVVGAIAKGGSSNRGPSGMRDAALPYVGAFERDDKRAMQQQMRARLPKRKDIRAALDKGYREFVEVVRAEPFDAAKAAKIMEEQFERAGQFQKVGREVSIERISEMSVEKRAAYADRLEYRLDNPRKHGKRKER